MHDFKNRNPDAKVELLNVDSREGIAIASLYDIMHHPAILAMTGEGSLVKEWQGEQLPLIDEVASYAYAT